jgi:transposase
MGSIDSKFGMTPETLRIWLRRAEVAGGKRPGVTSEEKQRIRQLERENRELRRANEILKAASALPSATAQIVRFRPTVLDRAGFSNSSHLGRLPKGGFWPRDYFGITP